MAINKRGPYSGPTDGSGFTAIPDMATATNQANIETDTAEIGVAGVGLNGFNAS